MIGRALRLHESKKETYVLDFGECIQSLLKKPRTSDPELEDDIFEYNDFNLCSGFKAKELKPMLKQCAHCLSEMHVFLRVCPHCLKEQPKSTDKIVPDTIDFPDLMEYLSLNELKSMRYFRQELVKCFKEDNPLNIAVARCSEKFKVLPSIEWGKGAIFQDRYQPLNYSFYKWYLSQLTDSEKVVSYSLSIEFGDYSNDDVFIPDRFFGEDLDSGYKSKAESASLGEMQMIDKMYQFLSKNK
jgi:hypothetical protein